MARKVLVEGYGYSLVPSTRTLTIPKFILQERLILVTNISSNKVIYNFSDPSLGYTSFTTYIDPTTGNETTTIVLKYDTTTMTPNDEIQILVDEPSQEITPTQTLIDPTNKLRVTQPQALIDTDFEYGTQYSKWEAEGTIDNRPYFYQSSTTIPNITSIIQLTNSKTVTVTTSQVHGLQIGQPIVVLDSFFGPANGNFIIETTPSTTTFTYTAKITNTLSTTSIQDINKTAIYQGNIFSNASIGGAPATLGYASGNGAVTVTTNIAHGLSLGNEIAVVGTSGLTGASANGNFVVATVNSATQFTYYAGSGGTGTIIGNATSPSAIVTANANAANSLPASQAISNTITLGTAATAPTFGSGSLSNIQIGSIITGLGIPVATVVTGISTTGNITTLTLSNVTTAALTGTSVSFFASVYVRPQSQFNHRPFDGGVLFSGNSLSNNTAATRQTRRYFRYQSGKGIQISSGTVLKPYSNVDQLTASSLTGSTAAISAISASGSVVTYTTSNTSGIVAGQYITITGASQSGFNGNYVVATVTTNTNFTVNSSATGLSSTATWTVYPTITVQTKEKHNIIPGVLIQVTGSTDAAYNTTSSTVVAVTAWNKFTYIANGLPAALAAPGPVAVAVIGWTGSATRLGLFDNQNGIFFEYDGATFSAVRRSSVFQIAGKVTLAYGSTLVTQTDTTFATLFSKQISPGDYVVLRGTAYRVTDVLSDTQFIISPGYRGIDSQYVTVSKVIDTKMAQSSWNLDRMDGTGPSGYKTDLTKMQMFYLDYTWYGAGFVRWGLRGIKGDVTYAHKMPNNNINTEAYMRSGNLPARYEVVNNPPITTLSATIDNAQTTIPVASTSGFPSSGTIGIRSTTATNYSQAITAISGSGTQVTYNTANTTGLSNGQYITIAGASYGPYNGTFLISSFTPGVNIVVVSTASGTTSTATWSAQSLSTSIEYVNYTGITSTSFTGVTRAKAGNTSGVTLTIASGSSIGTVSDASSLQPGMRVVGSGAFGGTNSLAVPENTFIQSIAGTQITLSQAVTSANPSVYFLPMGATGGTAFTVTTSNPIAVELAFPSFSPLISHWGTSVIMDGRFDDDKSLLFTYGQTQQTVLGNASGYYPVTAITNNGSSVTYSTSNTTGLTVGQPISISGATQTQYNQTGAIISSVLPNVSFTIQQTVSAGATSTATATFGTPTSTLYAGTGGSNIITVPNLNNISQGQVMAGDTSKFVSGSVYTVNTVTTSQPGNITSISTATSTIAITGITNSAGVVTYATSNTTGIVAGQYITVSGATATAYNGTFLVNSFTTNTNFTVVSNATGATSTATGLVYTTTYATTDASSTAASNKYVTVSNAVTSAFNGTFVTTAATSGTSFSVITQNPVSGVGSTAQVVVYTATLSSNIGGSGSFYQNANLYGASSKALFSIRIAPSVDNGIPANLGQRELINRMQLVLRGLDLSTSPLGGSTVPVNILVTALLNGVPSTTTSWTNVVKNQIGVANSSLAMIADYAGGYTTVNGGEVTGGFFTSSTTSLDLSNVRDLGNSILGGGGTTSNTNIYPDGPDTLTIIATNLSAVPVAVSGRLSWSEAQA